MVSDKAFIFHIVIPFGNNFSLVPRSRLSVKVTNQGLIFQKLALKDAFVFHRHIFFIITI